jgi:predicted small lipoprotein YifL
MRLAFVTGVLGLAAAAALVAGCGKKGPERPSREVVSALLQREADELKRNGEQIDPVLRVKATWTIASIDLREAPGDPDHPWTGTIHFKIRGETKDTGGVVVDEFEKRFDYVYTTSVGKWVFQLAPAAP